METNNKTNNLNKHNMVKNPNWQEADQLRSKDKKYLNSYIIMNNKRFVW